MTIFERALDFLAAGEVIGLGSGRASAAFIRLLGERVRQGFAVRGVPTSQESDTLARSVGVPLVSLEEGFPLAVTVDGADEVDPQLNLIKGYGRALVREKVVAAASKKLVILVGPGKAVGRLGERGKLPVEVLPFALPLCRRRLEELGCRPVLYEHDGKTFVTDNGNCILDCALGPIADPAALEAGLRAIPGVVGTGLFLGMADVVLVGDDAFNLLEERRRGA
jgi:ribose 5-phosphate isomerase A